MIVFVTPRSEDDRFVIYLKTSVCRVMFNSKDGLYFESSLDKLATMKDFFLNFSIKQMEIREYPDGKGALIVRDEVYMQLDDINSIKGIKVPILTVL